MLRARVKLLLLLLPVIGMWYWLSFSALIVRSNSLFAWDDGKHFALLNSQDSILFDIDARQYTGPQLAVAAWPPNDQGVCVNVSVVESNQSEHRIRFDVYSHSKNRVLRTIEREFPIDAYPRVVGNRYVVADTATEFLWLDLDDPDEQWKTLTLSRGDASWSWAGKTSKPVFRRSAFKPLPAGSTQTPKSYTELFGFDAQGQLRLLNSWQTLGSKNESLHDSSFQWDSIASLDTTGSLVEFRSLDDGRLLKAVRLEPPIDITKQKFSFQNSQLTVSQDGTYRYFSLVHERWLRSPFDIESDWTSSGLYFSPSSRIGLWVAWESARAVVVDLETDEEICQLQNLGGRYAFLDDNTLVSTDPLFNLTIRKHDIETGATLLTWRPFWWVAPTLGCVLFVSAIWLAFWFRLSRSSEIWAWFDLHVVLALLMSLIVLRLKLVGDAVDVARLPYQHAIYLAGSFVLIGWVWLILGRSSIVSRLSTVLIFYAIICAALSQSLSENVYLAWTGISVVTIPGLIVSPLLAIARLRDWKWTYNLPEEDATDSCLPQSVTLGQLMFATATVALLAVSLRQLLPGISGALQVQWPVGGSLVVIGGGMAALVIGAAHGPVRRVGQFVAAFAISLLIGESLVIAVGMEEWKPFWFYQYEGILRYLLGMFSVVFYASSLMHGAGFQLTKRSPS